MSETDVHRVPVRNTKADGNRTDVRRTSRKPIHLPIVYSHIHCHRVINSTNHSSGRKESESKFSVQVRIVGNRHHLTNTNSNSTTKRNRTRHDVRTTMSLVHFKDTLYGLQTTRCSLYHHVQSCRVILTSAGCITDSRNEFVTTNKETDNKS